ncbi:MAG: hypothetical protein GYA24_02030 [Candidatus Lokiarchaeota archaeon]|nr:hypothetical protein [Candidatus Lokiarchaeota archaeon]
MPEEEKRGSTSQSSQEDKEEIEKLGLKDQSNAGFGRLMQHDKPNEPEKEKKKFIGFK